MRDCSIKFIMNATRMDKISLIEELKDEARKIEFKVERLKTGEVKRFGSAVVVSADFIVDQIKDELIPLARKHNIPELSNALEKELAFWKDTQENCRIAVESVKVDISSSRYVTPDPKNDTHVYHSSSGRTVSYSGGQSSHYSDGDVIPRSAVYPLERLISLVKSFSHSAMDFWEKRSPQVHAEIKNQKHNKEKELSERLARSVQLLSVTKDELKKEQRSNLMSFSIDLLSIDLSKVGGWLDIKEPFLEKFHSEYERSIDTYSSVKKYYLGNKSNFDKAFANKRMPELIMMADVFFAKVTPAITNWKTDFFERDILQFEEKPRDAPANEAGPENMEKKGQALKSLFTFFNENNGVITDMVELAYTFARARELAVQKQRKQQREMEDAAKGIFRI